MVHKLISHANEPRNHDPIPLMLIPRSELSRQQTGKILNCREGSLWDVVFGVCFCFVCLIYAYIYIKYLAVTFKTPPFSNKVLSPSGLLVQLNTMETSIPVQTPLYFRAVIFKYPLAFFSVYSLKCTQMQLNKLLFLIDTITYKISVMFLS